MSETQLPKCIHCGGEMQRTERWPKNPLVIICAGIILAVGALINIANPTSLGSTIGFGFILTSFYVGRKRKVWQCQNCGFFITLSKLCFVKVAFMGK